MPNGLRCAGCHGSGKIMSGGFVYAEHEACNGTGRLTDPELIIRQKLLQAHPGLTEEQANSAIKDATLEIKSEQAKQPISSIKIDMQKVEEKVLQKRKPGRPKMRVV